MAVTNISDNTGQEAPESRAWAVALKKAIDVLDIPGKVLSYGVSAYAVLGLVLWPLLGWLPMPLIYLAWATSILAGLGAAVFGCYRWSPGKRWMVLVVLIVTGVFATSIYYLIPPSAIFTRLDVMSLHQRGEPLPPPFHHIEPIAWGRQYPGGTTYGRKLQGWRDPNGYAQWISYYSNSIPPNRVPQSIGLKDKSLDAAIGIYVFSGSSTPHRIGFDGRYQRVEVPAATDFGAEYLIAVFVFPLSQVAAKTLEESPDEILVY